MTTSPTVRAYLATALAIINHKVEDLFEGVPEDGWYSKDFGPVSDFSPDDCFIELEGCWGPSGYSDFFLNSSQNPQWRVNLQERSISGGRAFILGFQRGAKAMQVLVRDDEDAEFQRVEIDLYEAASVNEASAWIEARKQEAVRQELIETAHSFIYLASIAGAEFAVDTLAATAAANAPDLSERLLAKTA
jgi:hypothetical protein